MALNIFVLLLCLLTIYIVILFHQTLSFFRNVGIGTLLVIFENHIVFFIERV